PRRLSAAGLDVDVWEPRRGRPNFVATLPGHGRSEAEMASAGDTAAPQAAGGGGGAAAGGGAITEAAPSLMLVSHLDVVGAAPELFTPQIRDGRLYGRGSNDMKAGLAAAVIAAERLAAEAREAGGRSPLYGDLLVAGCADEEWESFGAEALVDRYRPTAAILPERTDFDVTVEHGGFTWFAIESTGVEAAGAEPEKGVDAIALLGPVLAGIATLDRDLEARPRAAYGRGSIHAATIEGGTQLPAYPGVCRLGVERCLIAGESVAQSRSEIEALLAAAHAADQRFAASSRLVVGREPVTLRRDDPVVLALVAAATAELGRAPRVRGDIGWADSGIFAEAGIPCAQFGPIGGGEHTSGEWVDVASVALVARVLEAAARRYCG
ncbi:MAG TPA: M20/M25/M40 family metallo-hydrolase, partial [Thermoleophilia bacterium]|nr:M20/M25/M40 family metallo-hydrolase [Thermoleophilia bacterium]